MADDVESSAPLAASYGGAPSYMNLHALSDYHATQADDVPLTGATLAGAAAVHSDRHQGMASDYYGACPSSCPHGGKKWCPHHWPKANGAGGKKKTKQQQHHGKKHRKHHHGHDLPTGPQTPTQFVVLLNMHDQFLGVVDAKTGQFVDAVLVRVQPPSKRERRAAHRDLYNGGDGGGSDGEYNGDDGYDVTRPPSSQASFTSSAAHPQQSVAEHGSGDDAQGTPFVECFYQPMPVQAVLSAENTGGGGGNDTDDDDDDEDKEEGASAESAEASSPPPSFPDPSQLMTDEERRMHERAQETTEMRRAEDASMSSEQLLAADSFDVHSERNGGRGGGGGRFGGGGGGGRFGGGGGGARFGGGGGSVRIAPGFRSAPSVRTMPFRAAPTRAFAPMRTVSPRLGPRVGPVSPRLAPFRRGLTSPLVRPSYAFNPFLRTRFGFPYYRSFVPFLPVWWASWHIPWSLWYPYPRYVYVLPSDRIFVSGTGIPTTLPSLPFIPLGMSPDEVSAMLQQLRSQYAVLLAEGYDIVPYFYSEGRPGQFMWIRHRGLPIGARTYGAPVF